MEYLSSIVFHTVILKMLSKEAKSRNVASFLYSGIMENLSSIVFHRHTENAFKRDKNQEMWLRFYVEYKIGVCTLKCFQKGPNQEKWLRFYIVEQWSMYLR